MPNWCSNYIKINGSVESMKPLYEFFKPFEDISDDNNTLVMNHLVPKDEEFDEIQSKGLFIINPQDNFYGTKWDFTPAEISIQNVEPEEITFSVSTAWAPPQSFCWRLAKKYGVNVYIQYEEGGCDFCGFSRYDTKGTKVEGEIYNHIQGLYILDNECFWNEVDGYAEMSVEREESITKFLGYFPFVTDKNDLADLTEVYHRYKK